jgi:phosphate transport system protein
MSLRVHFNEELKHIHTSVTAMSVKVEESIRKALRALDTKDEALARQVIEEDGEIDRMQREIEDRGTVIIAREQPVAGDLRELVTAIKIVSNLERIGDHARHLARGVSNISPEIMAKALPKIKAMAEHGLGMLRDAVEAFTERDAELAQNVASRDDKIDKMHHELYESITTLIQEKPSTAEDCVSVMFLNRFMERLGDHVTNICEWVYFAKTGNHIELNA